MSSHDPVFRSDHDHTPTPTRPGEQYHHICVEASLLNTSVHICTPYLTSVPDSHHTQHPHALFLVKYELIGAVLPPAPLLFLAEGGDTAPAALRLLVSATLDLAPGGLLAASG